VNSFFHGKLYFSFLIINRLAAFSAIEKGKTGQKIDLNVDTLAIYPKLILPTKNNLQLLVLARGKASVVLDQRLFNKNDKKVKVR